MTNGICGIDWTTLSGRILINDHDPRAVPSAAMGQAVGAGVLISMAQAVHLGPNRRTVGGSNESFECLKGDVPL
jgi:hypothetical protein